MFILRIRQWRGREGGKGGRREAGKCCVQPESISLGRV